MPQESNNPNHNMGYSTEINDVGGWGKAEMDVLIKRHNKQHRVGSVWILIPTNVL